MLAARNEREAAAIAWNGWKRSSVIEVAGKNRKFPCPCGQAVIVAHRDILAHLRRCHAKDMRILKRRFEHYQTQPALHAAITDPAAEAAERGELSADVRVKRRRMERAAADTRSANAFRAAAASLASGGLTPSDIARVMHPSMLELLAAATPKYSGASRGTVTAYTREGALRVHDAIADSLFLGGCGKTASGGGTAALGAGAVAQALADKCRGCVSAEQLEAELILRDSTSAVDGMVKGAVSAVRGSDV